MDGMDRTQLHRASLVCLTLGLVTNDDEIKTLACDHEPHEPHEPPEVELDESVALIIRRHRVNPPRKSTKPKCIVSAALHDRRRHLGRQRHNG